MLKTDLESRFDLAAVNSGFMGKKQESKERIEEPQDQDEEPEEELSDNDDANARDAESEMASGSSEEGGEGLESGNSSPTHLARKIWVVPDSFTPKRLLSNTLETRTQ